MQVGTRYPWMSLQGGVHPHPGESEWVLLPTVNVAVMSIALAHVARAVGVRSHQQVVLVLERAGWQCSADVVIPQGVHLLFLPASIAPITTQRTALAAF